VCARYGCSKRGSRGFVTPKPAIHEKPQPLFERDQNGYKLVVENPVRGIDEEYEGTLSEEEELLARLELEGRSKLLFLLGKL
jgi:hypothetical protein